MMKKLLVLMAIFTITPCWAQTPEEAFLLGKQYYYGQRGIAPDYSKAVYWLTKAAEQGVSDAQNYLGLCFEYGQGVGQSDSKAIFWYTKAAEQGNVFAQCNLGKRYHFAKAFSKAVYWYKKAAEQGFSEAQNNLGACFEYGQGVAQNDSLSVYWYKKAAEQGYNRAQYNLGNRYYVGKGVKQDYSEAAYWYKKAAEQGWMMAQYYVGGCYENGQGVEQDIKQAIYWYTRAAEQGHSDAWYRLGILLYENKDIEAFKYLKAAIENQNMAIALKGDIARKISICYRYGRYGAPQNDAQADFWTKEAAKYGNIDAKKYLDLQDRMRAGSI